MPSAACPTSSTATSTCSCCRSCATPSSRWWRRSRRRPGCGNAAASPRARRLRDPKALAIDVLNLGFRAKAAQAGLATNPAFAGAYAFRPDADFAAIFPPFLDGLPDGGLIMCHPGFVDAALKSLNSLTDLRERELAYFDSDAFPRDLARRGVALAEPAGETGPAA